MRGPYFIWQLSFVPSPLPRYSATTLMGADKKWQAIVVWSNTDLLLSSHLSLCRACSVFTSLVLTKTLCSFVFSPGIN